MPIIVCELCGKPFNNMGVKLCRDCSKEIEDAYITARRFIYRNPKNSDFITIIDETGISEKALSYLINKGRIEVAGQTGGGQKCRACGKETDGNSLCQQCMTKLLKEKLTSHQNKMEAQKTGGTDSGKKKELPMADRD